MLKRREYKYGYWVMALLAIFIVGNAIAVPYLQDNRTRNRQRNASSQQVSADGKRAAGKGANASANGGGAKGSESRPPPWQKVQARSRAW